MDVLAPSTSLVEPYTLRAVTTRIGVQPVSVEAGMVAIVAVFVQSVILDRVVRGFDNALAYTILSREHERLAQRIREELGRGVTLFEAADAGTGEGKKALLCVVTRSQVGALRAIVRETDPEAFVIAANTSEVIGEGFTRLG